MTPTFMKSLMIRAAIMFVTIAGSIHAGPTPVPKAAAHERPRPPAGATGVFVAKLRVDGTVQEVLISRSTGNKVVDAYTVRGLSSMRFPPEILTKAERAKREKVLPITITAEELKKFRYY
jgi:hypothetical protein